ncbi:MAG: hypothetical protein WCU00_00650 [Candidatus Latescibacterota bacterium]
MKKSIMIVLVGNRQESALQVQKSFTEMGCFIKTRLGIHDGSPEQCTNTGLIILELVGDAKSKRDLCNKLKVIPNVSVELVEMSI